MDDHDTKPVGVELVEWCLRRLASCMPTILMASAVLMACYSLALVFYTASSMVSEKLGTHFVISICITMGFAAVAIAVAGVVCAAIKMVIFLILGKSNNTTYIVV